MRAQFFPNTPTYLTLFYPGTAGHFISNLLYCFYQPKEMFFSDFGNAHNLDLYQNYETESLAKYRFFTTRHLHGDKILSIIPKNECLPVFINAHNLQITYNSFFKKFPKGKIIFISHDDDDWDKIITNTFFKGVVDTRQEFIKDINGQIKWANLCKSFPFLMDKDINTISAEDFQYYLKHRKNQILKYINLVNNKILPSISPINWWGEKKIMDLNLPQDKHIHLPYKKILGDKEYTLNLLADFSGHTISDILITNYQKYLDSQQKLYAKYAPHLL